jgi:hypothetical protein
VDPRLAPLLADQAGVVSRRQALETGMRPHELVRLVRRHELSRVHPGVYVDHTGEPSWLQSAWAGVLLCWPAALAGQSALRAVEGPGSTRRLAPVEVAVTESRRARGAPGVVVRRVGRLDDRVQWHVGPPRMRYDEAAVDVAAGAPDDFTALSELSRAVQARRTTARRLLDTARRRDRLPRRDWIESVLHDVADGACSVLEHGYLTRVERPHGLATGRRQVRDRAGAGVVYRDVEYAGGFVVELDGRLFHDTTAQRDRDLDRDLVAATQGKDTVRLSYGQVYERACWTTGQLVVLLTQHGWRGTPRRCSPRCTAL